MKVDLPSHAEIRALVETTGGNCVSIYMPATPHTADADAERITFKNLANDALAQLKAAGVDKRQVAVFAEAFADLEDDPYFWRHQANSLALFATADEVSAFRLANRLEPAVVVGDRFFIKPLLRAVSFPNAGFVLALAQGSVRLIEFGGDYGPFEVDVADLPKNLDSVVDAAPGAGGAAGFGLLSPEGRTSRLRKYARQVDRAVRQALRGHELVVVLAATEPLASVFRSVSTLPTLADTVVAGNPENVPDHELVAAARKILDEVHHAEVGSLARLFSDRTGQDRTATDVADIAKAATFGAVEVLIVDIDQIVPGRVGDDGSVMFSDDAADGVVDEAARRVLLSGGRVVAVRADEVPGGGPAAATLRYP